MLAVVSMATVQDTCLFVSAIANAMIVETAAVTLKMFVLKVCCIHMCGNVTEADYDLN